MCAFKKNTRVNFSKSACVRRVGWRYLYLMVFKVIIEKHGMNTHTYIHTQTAVLHSLLLRDKSWSLIDTAIPGAQIRCQSCPSSKQICEDIQSIKYRKTDLFNS